MSRGLELCFTPAAELVAAFRKRQLSPVEVTEAVLAQIERVNPIVNAFVTVVADRAREDARRAEAALMRTPGKDLGPLYGVPVSIKDLVLTKGVRTTFGSLAFADFVPEEDALVVERLKTAGAILLGKTNTPEFGAGGNTKNRVFGVTRNPWRLSHTCGGSSGGAAVALAAGMGPLAQGSDTGGSLRTPASFCGVIGLRTSPGVVPVYPTPMAWDPLSVVGPMARTVEDAALMLAAIAGPDERAPLSISVDPGRWLEAARRPEVRGWRAAWSRDLEVTPVDPEVARVAETAACALQEAGCSLEEDHPEFGDVREMILPARSARMAATHGSLLPKWRDKMFGPLVWNIEQGAAFTAEQWAKAEMARTRLWHRVRAFFHRYHLLLTPTVAIPPFPHDWDYPPEINGRPTESYMDWFFLTYAITLTGLPAISVPAGWTADGLPVGLQIVGRWRDEASVLQAAAALEAVRPWRDRRPPLLMRG